uniref:Uncharacterized protein n=1 Tax=Salarias fasciatus TaxID=181472 RepID=A0A672FXQ3_SALFA
MFTSNSHSYYRLIHCELNEENCGSLDCASHLKELDLSLNRLQDEGVNALCTLLNNQIVTLEKLSLVDCGLTKQSCASLASVFESERSHLKHLDLSLNNLRNSGVESLCAGSRTLLWTLEYLRLSHCKLTKHSCAALASTFKSQLSHLKVLDLTGNHLMDSGIRVLCTGLKNPQCTMKTLKLSHCDLSKTSCGHLVSVLTSKPSHLQELDLSFNCLQDDGIVQLSLGLSNPNCGLSKLWYLSFSIIMISIKFCTSVFFKSILFLSAG